MLIHYFIILMNLFIFLTLNYLIVFGERLSTKLNRRQSPSEVSNTLSHKYLIYSTYEYCRMPDLCN